MEKVCISRDFSERNFCCENRDIKPKINLYLDNLFFRVLSYFVDSNQFYNQISYFNSF